MDVVPLVHEVNSLQHLSEDLPCQLHVPLLAAVQPVNEILKRPFTELHLNS